MLDEYQIPLYNVLQVGFAVLVATTRFPRKSPLCHTLCWFRLLRSRAGGAKHVQTHTMSSAVAWLKTTVVLLVAAVALVGCSQGIEFFVKHIRDSTGEQISEVVSYETERGLDNSSGSAPVQVQIEFKRNYKYQIIQRLTNDQLSGKDVQDKIVEFYKLPPNDPEGTTQTALCPVSVVIPPGQKAKVTIEWTERWAEGVINEGTEAKQGKRLGTYQVFMGYIEPCSLVSQENID